MEISLKSYLNYFCFIAFIICYNCTEKITSKEDKELSATIYIEAERLVQGSIESMLRLEKAIEIDPNNCDAIRELSVAYLKRGLAHKWKLQFDKAVECDPNIWQPMRGYLYLSFYRDYKNAIADFNASDTLTPNFIDAPQGQSVDYWRGIAYLGLKDYKNSLDFFNKYITTEAKEWGEDMVEVTAFLYRGIALFENLNFELALKDFDKVLVYNRGNSADAKYYKALILKDSHPIEANHILESSIEDFKNGYYNQRDYVEILKQIYLEDLLLLAQELKEKLNLKS
jgi:tetratricopeptide (TPR) repeat protein